MLREIIEALAAQYDNADNMTDRLAALTSAVHSPTVPGTPCVSACSTDFRNRFDDRAAGPHRPSGSRCNPAAPNPTPLAAIAELMQDTAFSINNPKPRARADRRLRH